VPVIILSARERETDKVGALDLGADDYVTKPFGVGELMARVSSTLRRRSVEQDDADHYDCDGLAVDLERRRVTVDDEEVKLTPKEYDILTMLVKHAGRVVTHQFLLREIWGPTYTGETHYLRVYVGQLRQKIEKDPAQPHYILTEPGVGYRLIEPE
jgi:two-component system KDP operon response regulator KdpE